MLDYIAQNIAVQYGALGLLVGCLVLGNVILWRRLVKLQDDYSEQIMATTAALVELNVLLRGRHE